MLPTLKIPYKRFSRRRWSNNGSAIRKVGETGRFFVDCTGFSSQIICKKLNVPFISYKNMLFNDAVAMPTPLPEDDQLLAKRSQRPLAVVGYGTFLSESVRQRLCLFFRLSRRIASGKGTQKISWDWGSETEARHLKMRVGRLSHCWEKNCLAVGLSQGFIEPLEATRSWWFRIQ